MLTPKAVAERLGVSQATIYGLIAAGKLKHCRIGLKRGVIRVSETHLEEFLSGAEPVHKEPPASVPARRVKLKHLHA